MRALHCRMCGATLAPNARFCSACGAMEGTLAGGPARLSMIVGILAVLEVVAALAWNQRRLVPASPDGLAAVATADAAAPPDISRLSPRERFDRLYNRSMRAAESGDASALATFAPMALLAYTQLDTVDADARYHAAMLKLHTGDPDGAKAQADSILEAAPGHLFGYVIRVTVARWQKDSAALVAARREFAVHFDREIKAARPEYGEHRTILDDVWRDSGGRAPD